MPRWLLTSFVVLGVSIGCGAEDDSGPGDDGGATATDAETTDPSGTPTGSPSGSASGDPSVGETGDDTSGPGSSDDGSEETAADEGSSSGEEEELIGCYDYDAFMPTTVSFRTDVMPILAARCASCHADPEASVYYGMGGTTEAEASAVYTILLEGVPKQAPHLSFIVPSDPVRSYMMAKVEYLDPGGTCSAVQCDEPGCELLAPPAGQLPEAELAILRSWVMGGALDD